MLQKRRRRLFALTYLTSLTLASWTSKKLFNPRPHVYSAGSRDIFPHNVFYPSFSPMSSEVAVSISSIGKVLYHRIFLVPRSLRKRRKQVCFPESYSG